ncbi:hypothetical protein LMG29542_06381 [Paraburkholderia humisilvae]|uniref:Uncharacterized protein n=1 Tax=Paraburkholderia humisilvae TaxID=627669 RepID=A0A6J5EVB3_9BURK|nr:hypothetical protein LMG29542_06381 [Paraburkholderia humisilvae]
MGMHIGDIGHGYHETNTYRAEPGASEANPGHTDSPARPGASQTGGESGTNTVGTLLRPAASATRRPSDGTRNPAQGTGANGAAVPARYIAKPDGELQSDSANPGIFVDGKGQRYLQHDGNWYRASRDNANGAWRVVQQDDPVKPGIAIERNANGQWHTDNVVGLRGGGGSEADKARAEAAVHAKKTELQTKQAEGTTKKAELDSACRARAGAENRIADLDSKKYDATRRLHEASAQASLYRRQAEQATRDYEDAKRRYESSQPRSSTQRADLPPGIRAIVLHNTASRMTSVFADESTMDAAQWQQRKYQDSHREWEGKRRDAESELSRIDAHLNEAWRDKVHAEDNQSTLELDSATLESDRLNLERQLADLERERAKLD